METGPYIVITPVRNEAKYLQLTVDSMVAQTVRPRRWFIVDDGSTDDTAKVAVAAAQAEPWISVLQRPDRGFRLAGGGVMDAFYAGYDALGQDSWDFLVKLDGDLSFPPHYFEECLKRFGLEPRLGIGGGSICNIIDGALSVESKIDPAFHVRGATKIYRRKCWDQLQGLIRAPGWDTVDEVKANMLGWTTRTFGDLKVEHHRAAGEAYGRWSNLIKNGRANYVAGYHPLFMFLKSVRRLFEKPYFIGGCGLWLGFLSGYFKPNAEMPERAVIKYFRRQQMNRLLGKRSLWSQPSLASGSSPVSPSLGSCNG